MKPRPFTVPIVSSFILALIVSASVPLSIPACSGKKITFRLPVIPDISLVEVAGGFTRPVHLASPADGSGRLFVVEQGGTIKIIKEGVVLQQPFLDLSSLITTVGSEQGLLGLAFPLGYGLGKSHFYVYYTGTQGVGDGVLARYATTADADVADTASGQVLLTIVEPFTNHNGGHLAFGPEGYLYIGVGDGGSGGDPFGNGQNTDTLLGKILRIDVESRPGSYTVPETNPFVGLTGRRPEIWAIGLRNPWRFSFDRGTGDLFIADVGQDTYEEVDVQPAVGPGGINYGWSTMEGLHCYSDPACDTTGLTLPVLEYDHSSGDCSITGGFVYRGGEFPALRGVYLYGDYCSGRIWGMRRAGGGWENRLLLDTNLAISTFGQDEAGNLYVADHGGGDIYKIIVPTAQ